MYSSHSNDYLNEEISHCLMLNWLLCCRPAKTHTGWTSDAIPGGTLTPPKQAPANHTTRPPNQAHQNQVRSHIPRKLLLHIPDFQLAVQRKWAWSPGKARPVSSIGRAWDSYEYAISRLRVRPPHRAVPILYHDWEVLSFFLFFVPKSFFVCYSVC